MYQALLSLRYNNVKPGTEGKTLRTLQDPATLTEQGLSPRQYQVLALVADGRSDKEIASQLGVSRSTVKTYLSRLYRYYGLRNRAQAGALFVRLQLHLPNDFQLASNEVGTRGQDSRMGDSLKADFLRADPDGSIWGKEVR